MEVATAASTAMSGRSRNTMQSLSTVDETKEKTLERKLERRVRRCFARGLLFHVQCQNPVLHQQVLESANSYVVDDSGKESRAKQGTEARCAERAIAALQSTRHRLRAMVPNEYWTQTAVSLLNLIPKYGQWSQMPHVVTKAVDTMLEQNWIAPPPVSASTTTTETDQSSSPSSSPVKESSATPNMISPQTKTPSKLFPQSPKEQEDERKPAAQDGTAAAGTLDTALKLNKRPGSPVDTEGFGWSSHELGWKPQNDYDEDIALQMATEASLLSHMKKTATSSVGPVQKSSKRRKAELRAPSVYDPDYDATDMNPLLQNDDDDYELALSLQAAESAVAQLREAEDKSMYDSTSGQAWKLVEKISAFHQKHCGAPQQTVDDSSASSSSLDAVNPRLAQQPADEPFLSLIAVDDMVYTAERFLATLHDFHRNAQSSTSPPTPNVQWDLGYHYTTSENLSRIRTDGLLSKEERTSQDIHAKHNGSVYGDGIYAASNPHSFRRRRYGNVGVLVVRLHGGRQKDLVHRQRRRQHRPPHFLAANCAAGAPRAISDDEDDEPMGPFDSTVVSRGDQNEFVVLRTAGQCLPLCTFLGSRLLEGNNTEQLETYTQALRNMLQEFLCDILGGIKLPAKPPNSEVSSRIRPYVNWQAASQRSCLPLIPTLAIPPTATVARNNVLSEQGQIQPNSFPAPALSYTFNTPQSSSHVPVALSATSQQSSLPIVPAAQQASFPTVPAPPIVDPVGLSGKQPTEAVTMKSAFTRYQPVSQALWRSSAGSNPDFPSPNVLTYAAPPTLTSLAEVMLKDVSSPLRHSTFSTISQECAICLDPLMRNDNGSIFRLQPCGHLFHRNCLLSLLDSVTHATRQCPTCRSNIPAQRGTMPSGTMTVREDASRDCAGHPVWGSFVIDYKFEAGQVQAAYHPSPGRAIPPAARTAYIPRTVEGRHLVHRLKWAFARGLTFTIDASTTPSLRNAITWGGIPHKYKTFGGGPLGFPDATYIDHCNKAMDRLGVPEHETLDEYCKK